MLDNVLFPILIGLINAGMAAQGYPEITCVQNYQPTQQGVNSGPQLFLYKIGPDELLGMPERQGVQGTGNADFMASISGNVMTVTSLISGSIAPNQGVVGLGVPAGVIITAQTAGTQGATGTYTLNRIAGNIASTEMQSAGTYTWTETQQLLSLFQITALSTQDPANPNQLTASDLANLAAHIMQSTDTVAQLEAKGIGVLKVKQVRNPYFVDDRQRYEASPSFDFTISNQQTTITGVPIVSETDFQLLRV